MSSSNALQYLKKKRDDKLRPLLLKHDAAKEKAAASLREHRDGLREQREAKEEIEAVNDEYYEDVWNGRQQFDDELARIDPPQQVSTANKRRTRTILTEALKRERLEIIRKTGNKTLIRVGLIANKLVEKSHMTRFEIEQVTDLSENQVRRLCRLEIFQCRERTLAKLKLLLNHAKREFSKELAAELTGNMDILEHNDVIDLSDDSDNGEAA